MKFVRTSQKKQQKIALDVFLTLVSVASALFNFVRISIEFILGVFVLAGDNCSVKILISAFEATFKRNFY